MSKWNVIRNGDLKRLFVLLFFCGMVSTGWAQEFSLSGRVTDANNKPINGASVQVKGKSVSTLTGEDGTFSLSLTVGDVLEVSYVGYIPEEMTVTNRNPVTVLLTTANNDLDEVVVIGYGTARKRDLTGAVGSVKGDDIRQVPVTTAAQALTGKVAGVNVVTQSGAPGADVNITVRGGTSITGSTAPLYVVDGFVMEDALMKIDANDIENIDILKDASATAIYGARGANGVVLITTKSAKSGRTSVDYNAYMSVERLSQKLDLLGIEEYVKYQYEYQTLAGRQANFANMYGGDVDAPDFASGAYSRIHNDYGSRAGIDWQEEVFGGNGILQNHNVNISGGNEKTKLMLSYNNTNQDGILAKSGFRRNSIRAKVDHQLFEGVNVDFNSLFQDANRQGGGSLGGMLKMSALQPVTGGVRYTDEEMLYTDIGEDLQAIDSQYDIFNPIIMNDARNQERASRLANVNVGLTARFLDNFTFRTQGSYQWGQTRNDFWDDGRTMNARNNRGPYGSIDNAEGFEWQWTNTLSWMKDMDKHHLNLMVGHEVRYEESQGLKHEYFEFPPSNFGLKDVSLAGRTERGESKANRYGIVSGFFRGIYNYDDRYLLTATVRADGVSTFRQGNKWGAFPSASAAWNIHNESFMEDNGIFDQLKLRFGYGTTGNDKIGSTRYATLYGSTVVAVNNTTVIGVRPSNVLGNPDLVWEKTQTANLALDLAFLNNRINLTADFYNNESKNLLLEADIPTSTGYSKQYQNIATLRNRGVELSLNSLNIRNDNFQWKSAFNITFNRSRVGRLFGSAGNEYMITSYDSRVNFYTQVGGPVSTFYGYKYDGVYTTDDFVQNGDGTYTLKDGVASLKGKNRSSIKPGDVKYLPVTGQTDENGNPVWSPDDRTELGNPEPKFFGGVNNEFIYKGFDLSVFLNFAYGNKVFNMNTQRFMGPYLPNQNSLGNMADRFTLIDPITGLETTDLDRLAALNPNQHDANQVWSLNSGNNIAISDPLDYYLEDASFLRINNITLGYTLPGEVSKKAFIQRLRFYVTLNNVHTFTKYSGYDPEVSATDAILTRGVDNSAYPRIKSFVAGINLTF
ncbi:SusC/RagA family TonB-linked outer membrane protein [Sphingobacterium chuzhouense]|uniref:TonB-dependent receptor n=1 Tax=Sphingobacterium chuzhouense TaxID=1742264 RepID=A0ABR7XMU1_9SPHI|nr:TonB-dependent receptor [Sphingobacterium chuzhouense]MBD1420471.1 TonB-dependent receptor [Sphingobacterium chuzhouense]